LKLMGAGLASAVAAARGEAAPRQNGDEDGGSHPPTRPSSGGTYVGELAAPPLERVRAGLIGLGARGSGHVGLLLKLDGVEIKALCDNHEPTARRQEEICREAGHDGVKVYAGGDYDYRNLLEQEDLDIVVISTPWHWHAPMAIETMMAGKHAFVEVPMALTVDDLWRVVDTAEKTRRHCMMMENVCYGREELMVLNMCRHGLFGDLLHGEGAYIHDLREQMKDIARGTGSWRTDHQATRNGNLYPTHGLGPIAQYMGIDRTEDRFDTLVSMGSPALGRQEFAQKNFPASHLRNRTRYICGDLNTSLIETEKGRTIMVQYDTTSPRPYTRHNLIQGTHGTFGGFPDRIHIEGRTEPHHWEEGEALEAYHKEFEHPLWKHVGEVAKKAGGHGGMDFVMLWRMVSCLRAGEPLDQNVYEGASWSVVSPLSEKSVAKGAKPVRFPDFTRGRWKTTRPLGIAGE
jgi:hypothetical protein